LFAVARSDSNSEEVCGRRASRRHKLWQGSAASFQPRFETRLCTLPRQLQTHDEIGENPVRALAMSHMRGASSASLEPPKLSIEDPGARDLGL
jgi:hypothetical protein